MIVAIIRTVVVIVIIINIILIVRNMQWDSLGALGVG